MITNTLSQIKNRLQVQRINSKAVLSSLCLIAILAASVFSPFTQSAEARHRYNDRYSNDRYYNNDRPIVGYTTGKILKGGLVGAGIGAGSAIVFEKPLLKSSLIGAGIGAGVQAIRYSNW